MNEILARYRTRRSAKVRLLVVHTNESDDIPGGAVRVARYCQLPADQRGGSTGGYHELVDNAEAVRGAHDNDVVAGAAGANSQGWHCCIIGTARQTADQWDDIYSSHAVKLAAARVREAADRFDIPKRRLTWQQVKAGEMGICGHVDVSKAFGQSSHTDPGPHFPWDRFMALVGTEQLTEDDLPLNDEDKKWIADTVLSMLRTEGVSGAADPRNPATTAIIGEVRKVPGWTADELDKRDQ